MNIKYGLLSGLKAIIFIVIFAEIFGKDPITYYNDSSMNIKVVIIIFILVLLFLLFKKENK